MKFQINQRVTRINLGLTYLLYEKKFEELKSGSYNKKDKDIERFIEDWDLENDSSVPYPDYLVECIIVNYGISQTNDFIYLLYIPENDSYILLQEDGIVGYDELEYEKLNNVEKLIHKINTVVPQEYKQELFDLVNQIRIKDIRDCSDSHYLRGENRIEKIKKLKLF